MAGNKKRVKKTTKIVKTGLKKTTVWYSIHNGGDGSANLQWFLTEEEAETDQENLDEGWGEPCYGSVETFEGSDIHKEAIENSQKRRDAVQLEDEEDEDIVNDISF